MKRHANNKHPEQHKPCKQVHNKHQKPGFWHRIFLGPHIVNGKEISEEESELILQQLIGWSRME